MKSVTFNQGLLVVGLVGLTWTLSQDWSVVGALHSAYKGSVASGWVHTGAVFQGLALALPVATVAIALRRLERKSAPMNFTQLLVATGLFGLIMVTTTAPYTPIVLEVILAGLAAPSPVGPILAQVVAFAIPLIVIVVAWGRRARWGAALDEAITIPRLVTCLTLFGLMVAAAAVATATVVLGGTGGFGSTFRDASAITVMVIGGLLLLALFALRSQWALVPVEVSARRLFVTAGLFVAGSLGFAANSALAVGGPFLIAVVMVAALFWAKAIARGNSNGTPTTTVLGGTLTAVGLVGIALATAGALQVVRVASPAGWPLEVTVSGFVMVGMAGVLNLAALSSGLRRLRVGRPGEWAMPRARAVRVSLVTFQQALEGVGILGLTITLVLAVWAILLWINIEFPDGDPSVAVSLALLLVAIVLPLAIAGTRRALPPDSVGDGPSAAAGLSFSGLLTVVGLFGLVLVAAASPISGLGVSVAVWQGYGPWKTMLTLQVVAFAVPLAIIAAARVRGWHATRSADGDSDAITLPRLALALALLGPAIVATGLPGLPDVFLGEASTTSLNPMPLALVQVVAGGVVLGAGLLMILSGESRLATRFRNAGLPVTVALLALSVVVVVSSYWGVTWWSLTELPGYHTGALLPISLAGLAVVTFLWFRSDEDVSPEAASFIAMGRRVSVRLLGLAFVIAGTPGLVEIVIRYPTRGYAILMIGVFALAYLINVWPLVGAARDLRTQFAE